MNTSPRPPSLLWPLGCAWLLGLICFQLPGREAPETMGELDIVALVKVAVRLGTIGILGITLLRAWRLPSRPVVFACLAPYGMFVAWAVVSAAWSPLRAVSLGQASGLVCMFLLAACLATLWQGPRDTSRILFNLTLATILFSGAIIAVDLVAHDLSGLDREVSGDSAEAALGFVHPTTAGATGSIGMVLLVGSYLCGQWRWTKPLLLPGVAVFALVIFLAMSRMAVLMALAALAPLLVVRLRAHAIATATLLLSLAGVGLMLFDPGMELSEGSVLKVMEKLQRGESTEQLSSFTGRTDLWDAIWREFYGSPLIGQGYFVTSAAGELDVWSGPANRSAHNVLLQVLVSTGIVGATLFVVGLAWPLSLAARTVLADANPRHSRYPEDRKSLAILLAIVGLWFLGWGQLSESFMGPVQPESVVFYSLLGVTIAQVHPSLLFFHKRGRTQRAHSQVSTGAPA